MVEFRQCPFCGGEIDGPNSVQCNYGKKIITLNAHTGEQVGIWCCLHDVLNVGPDDYCSRGEKKGATE